MIETEAREDTLTGLLESLADFLTKKIDKQLPARVVSVSSDRQFVTVQPLVKLVKRDGEQLARATIAQVPVLALGAGDMLVSCPIVAGSLGWISANDRDISLFLQGYEESTPNTRRRHSFNDAVFIPDVMKGYTIATEDSSALVIQNLSGSTKIAIDNNEIRITAPSVKINGAEITSAGDVVSADGKSLTNHTHSQPPDSNGSTEQETGPPS